MNTILLVLLPILFFIGFQAGRSKEMDLLMAERAKMNADWVKPCDFNEERKTK